MSQGRFSFYDGLVPCAAITLWTHVPAGTMRMSECVCAAITCVATCYAMLRAIS